jgi:hypothetical protein
MATLVSKVRAFSKSTTTITSNSEVVNFITAGAVFLTNSIPKDLLEWSASDSSNITHSNGFIVSGSTANVGDRIVSVRRNGIVADQIPQERIYAESGVLTTSSLFTGTTIYPKWYMQNGRVYIKPNPTTGAIGKVTYVGVPSITTGTSNTAYNSIENPMILYGAAMDCLAISGKYGLIALNALTETTGDARDALDKAQYIIDASSKLSQGEDVEYYIAQEDTEMMLANVQVAAQEVNRALAEIRGMEQISRYTMEFAQRADLLFKQAYQEVQQYVAMNSKIMGLQLMTQQGKSS